MNGILKQLLARHERDIDHIANVKAGIAAVLGMCAVGWLAQMTGQPLLLAPFGATAVLLFGQPTSPLSQPINVMLGYLVGTVVFEATLTLVTGTWLAASLSVGLTIVLMRALRVTHPPAGALPIMAFGQSLHGAQLFGTVFIGSVVLIGLALFVHWIPPRRAYPLPAPAAAPLPIAAVEPAR